MIRSLILLVLFLIPIQANAASYAVRPGDTLSSIAVRAHTTVAALVRANGITNPNVIRIGRYLTIPDSALRPLYYRVRWGDTLSGIAARYHLSLTSLRGLNPNLGTYLLAGSSLRLCRACTAAPAPSPATTAATASSSGARYLVQAGDTLSGIAVRYGVSSAAIMVTNRIADAGRIQAGTWLVIPGAATQPVSASTAASGFTDPSLARAVIQAWSRTYGISSSLPLAVAWQESGFNQAMVSSTGAVGVMQVEPYTRDVISGYLKRPIDLNNLDQNVQAGVFWLTHLLVRYGWNVRLAVAAYYQGAKSIDAYGLFTDTAQYVNNVLSLQSRFGS